MLRLRFAARVPDHAVNVAYVESKDLRPKTDVSLLDLSHERVENLTTYSGGEFYYDHTSGRVDTKDLVISDRSVLSRNVGRPIPLYYKYSIGHSTYVMQIDDKTITDMDVAKLELLKTIRILDRKDNKVDSVQWDIVPIGAITDPYGAVIGYNVDIYTDRQPNRAETFKIQYQAARSSDGAIFPNHIEVINATPTLAAGTDYTFGNTSTGYTLGGLPPSADADCIGLFYTGILAWGVLTTNDGAKLIQLTKDDLNIQNFSTSNKSIQEVVSEINEADDVPYNAVALNDGTLTRIQNVGVNVYSYGYALKQSNIYRVKYLEETNVKCLMPYDDPDYLPWYPRVDFGEFEQDGVVSGTACKMVFRPSGDMVLMPPGQYGGLIHDRLDEQPIMLGPRTLKLRRPNMDASTVVLYRGGQELTGLVDDYDETNSVLFLSGSVGDASNLYVSYSYTETSFIYTGIDLNPLSRHSPHLYGKYVGIYMTPNDIMGASPPLPSNPVTLDRTIWHIIGDSITEIVDAVAEIRYNTGELTEAILLGVYHIGQSMTISEVKLTDTRSRGGGILDSVDPSAVGSEEALMFMDISMWNGEPFPPTAVIADFPEEVIGTGVPQLRRDPGADPSGYYLPSGQLTLDQVEQKMRRYKAGGVIAIVNPEPDLNG